MSKYITQGLARIAFDQAQLGKAEQLYGAVLKHHSTNDEAMAQLGTVY